MKVILQEDVPNLGKTGDMLEVANGYARNFLLPRQFAILADEGNTRRLEHQRRIAAARNAKVLVAAKERADKISSTMVSFKRKASSDEKIFGSVTNQDIAEALAAKGVEVDKRSIDLPEPIRGLGNFSVSVRVHQGVDATVKVFVLPG